MKPSLDGAKLKLIRAQDHLETILLILDRFSYGDCEITPENDPNLDMVVLRVRLPKPPDVLSPIIGDFLFNVRSALDYIAWQLVLVNPPGEPSMRKTAFPICTTPEGFSTALKRKRLQGMADKAVTLIESLQPYSARDNPLRMLDELHNIDKHRMPNLVTAVATDTQVVWSRGPFMMGLFSEEIRDGAILGDIGLGDPELKARIMAQVGNMKMQGQASVFVAFDNMTSELMEMETLRVDAILESILEFVREIVFPTFEPFFN